MIKNNKLSNNIRENDIAYTLIGDYFLPNITLPTKETNLYFGKYSRMRMQYLKKYKRVLFVNLLTSDKLNEHLHDIEVQCNEMVEEIVKSLAKQNEVDENLKATNQMKWVGLMNCFKSQAEEIVLKDKVYS